VTILSETS